MYDDYLNRMMEVLSGPLPGEESHVQMAPIKRPAVEEARHWTDTRLSAVLILLYPVGEQLHTVLMLRPDYDGVHGNQVSFPGGKTEESDRDLFHTALREAEEELGIPGKQVRIIGTLSELYIPPSKALVTPVVGYMPGSPDYTPDPIEVAEVIEADVHDLLSDQYRQMVLIERKQFSMKVPAIQYGDYTIWGATAMMLNELRWVLNTAESN